MAAGSRAQQGNRAPAGAPPATGNAHLPPQPSLNPEFASMRATELVAHLKRHRRTSDFDDAALVLDARERRLAEVEERVRELQAEISALQQPRAASVSTARALQQQPRAADDAGRALQQQPRAADDAEARVRRGSGANGRGLTPAKKPYKALRMHAPAFPSSDDESVGSDAGVDPCPRHGSLRMNASPGSGGRSALQANKQPRRRRS